LLNELEDRSSRGEFVPACTILPTHVGLGEIGAIRKTLTQALAESTPAFTPFLTGASSLDEFRSDPEINRMLVQLFGY
jgi:hypothetical protein